MAATVDELTVNFFDEDGTQVAKELDKEVLSKGSWATIMFLYQDFNRASGAFNPPKITIRRYQKRSGEYKTASKFNFSSLAQARKVSEFLTKWADAAEAQGAGTEGDSDTE